MIDAIRRYLQGYPGLRDGVLHLDGLPETSYTYSLSVIPCQPVLKCYIDGGERRKSLFLLQSRRFFGENLPGQSENLQFFSDFDAWLRRKKCRRGSAGVGGEPGLPGSKPGHVRVHYGSGRGRVWAVPGGVECRLFPGRVTAMHGFGCIPRPVKLRDTVA